jgi:hypothetical protein
MAEAFTVSIHPGQGSQSVRPITPLTAVARHPSVKGAIKYTAITLEWLNSSKRRPRATLRENGTVPVHFTFWCSGKISEERDEAI